MVSINDESNIILLEDLRKLIDSARKSVAKTVNSTMTLLYWQIGKRIYTEILNENRAEYGKQIVINISEELTLFYGKGWSPRQIRYCLQIAELFPEFKIWHTMCAKLSWSHIRLLIRIEDALKRDFFTELCKLENWSVRQLQERINSMLYERTAIAKKSEELIKNDLKQLQDEDKLSPDLVFRDPYFLDFLGLTSEYSEKDLESAILVELQKFITELGQDFGFLARQKRISIDNRDYYIDLLFYHRRLKSLVVIDLKLGDFEAGYKGQMELYLRYLEKYEQVEGENSPIGLILCAGKNAEHIELLGLDKSNIRLAEYLTQLPPKEILQAKLHQSLEIARHRLHTQEQ
jgi:predicted nuclease of restriction endonuclease-like (RecB) superfamily